MEKHNKLEFEKQDEKMSVCETMKEDTSEVSRKIESHMPILFQNYSNLYSQYLHIMDDVFGTFYIAEKEILDRLNVDQGILKQIKENSNSLKNTSIQNIDISSAYFDKYLKMRIDVIKSFDNYMHMMIDSYAKMLTQFNKFF